jgi:hypothetical protein
MARAAFAISLVRRSALVLAFAVHPLLGQSSNAAVRVNGSVLDSLTMAPLASATVRFARADDPGLQSRVAGTDAAGRFEIALAPGRWLVDIEHPHLDSLGVTMPVQRIEVPASATFRVAFATSSARTLTRAYCGDRAHDDDVVTVGLVRDAGSDAALDSAVVLAQWTDLNFVRGAAVRTVPTASARTDRNGWYVLCGVPKRAELVAWAERGRAATGLIRAETGVGPGRLDLWLDPSSIRSSNAPDSAAAPTLNAELRRPAARTGRDRLRAQIVDAAGKAIPGARARVLGHAFAVSDQNGTILLDSLPGGSQTLEVRALGFVPFTRAVHLAAPASATDTITLSSVRSLLDTVRVRTGRVYAADATGFEARRKSGIGEYITRDEVDRWQPFQLTSLLQARPGVGMEDTKFGDQLIRMRKGLGGGCTPTVWVDGNLVVNASGGGGSGSIVAPVPGRGGGLPPQVSAPEAAGLVELNWLVRPSEIEGVEIYRRAVEVPLQFSPAGDGGCGALVIWTRWRYEFPRTPPP